jgi:hypothetical protein
MAVQMGLTKQELSGKAKVLPMALPLEYRMQQYCIALCCILLYCVVLIEHGKKKTCWRVRCARRSVNSLQEEYLAQQTSKVRTGHTFRVVVPGRFTSLTITLRKVHDKVTSIRLSASLFNFVLSGFWSTICNIARTRGSDNENVRN